MLTGSGHSGTHPYYCFITHDKITLGQNQKYLQLIVHAYLLYLLSGRHGGTQRAFFSGGQTCF